MNPITEKFMQFLSLPELDFGGEEDLALLEAPEALRERVAQLLDGAPASVPDAELQDLRGGLAQADWADIAHEFRARVAVASRFFDEDARNARAA